MPTIGELIKNARKKQNLTQEDLAELVGTTKSAISYYELNRRLPRYNMLLKIATALDIPQDEINATVGKSALTHENNEPQGLPLNAQILLDIFLSLDKDGQKNVLRYAKAISAIQPVEPKQEEEVN